MKNLPHQFNKLPTLRAILQAARDLGVRTGQDEDFGYELVGRGVYRFLNLTTPLAARVAQEKLKPTGSQGPRTAARDMRRLLTDFGFLAGAPTWAVTTLGTGLLAAPAGSGAERRLWQQAFVALAVTDPDGNESHPGCILLRLLADSGPLPKHALALALEPADDSAAEYARALSLVGLAAAARRTALGVSKPKDDDAVKILPAVALQAGLVGESGGTFQITAEGRTALQNGCGLTATVVAPGAPSGPTGTGTPPVSPPSRTPGTAASPPTSPERPDRVRRGRASATPGTSRIRRVRDRPTGQPPGSIDTESFEGLTREQQLAALELRQERNDRHSHVVTDLADRADLREGAEVHEDPVSFDLLVEPDDDSPLVLVEVKTVDDDAGIQTRKAIGQLIWYRHFIVEPRWPDRDIEALVVYDKDVDPAYYEFLEKLGIGAAVLEGGRYRARNSVAEATLAWFGDDEPTEPRQMGAFPGLDDASETGTRAGE